MMSYSTVIISIVLCIMAYLVGSISCAVITSKIMGLPDPRTGGSKNPGATNVLRLSGKKAAIITLFGDALKGFLPVMVGHGLSLPAIALSLVALMAFLGHIFPVFLGFKGGKGVATALGALLALSWSVGFAVILTWLLVAVAFRYSSLAALIAFALSPIYVLLFSNENYAYAVALMAIILFYRHRSNIQKLLAGTESKIGSR